jgi:ATP-binding protein involved in chromosome partitioning
MKHERKEIIVLAGKGGTGKTTVTWNVALYLIKLGYKVGILDIDISNPNIPQVANLEDIQFEVINNLIQPVKHTSGIVLMSVGFNAPPAIAILWNEKQKIEVVEQLYHLTNWPKDIDFLLFDAPAGTGSEITQITNIFQSKPLEERKKTTGAMVVTTPHPSAIADAMRAIDMIHDQEIPFLGTVMNMSKFLCSECNYEEKYYPNNWKKVKPIIDSIPNTAQAIQKNYLNTEIVTKQIIKRIGKVKIKEKFSKTDKLKQKIVKKGVQVLS